MKNHPGSVHIACLLLVIASSAASFSLSPAKSYTVKDLGSVSGPSGFSIGRAINASGQVTGQSGSTDPAVGDVFVYSNGTMTNLGNLGEGNGFGNGINASGQVAGYSINSKNAYRAFISKGDELIDIGDLGGGSAYGEAINDSGQVVGTSATPTLDSEPFLYSDGKMIGLGNLGSNTGWSTARGINNSGVVVGSSWTAEDVLHAFAWSNGTMTDLGTLGGVYGQAWAINDAGQITGVAYLANGAEHAFITTVGGTMKDLGVLAFINNNPRYGFSWGYAINGSGEVVGQASTSTDAYHAFVYDGKKMRDLNDLIPPSKWVMFEARAINDAGQIVCTGMDSAGNQHAFLLTPQ
jgi:probable HAF family extracellular repeat protein